MGEREVSGPLVTHPASATALRDEMLRMITGFALPPMLYVAARLGVADRLVDGPVNGDQLARDLNVDGDSLRRLLAALATHNVFATDGNTFRLTPLGELLGSRPGSLRATALYWGSPWVWNVWSELVGSIETGRPAFDRVHGQDFFAYLAQHHEPSSIFDRFMTETPTERHAAIAEAYDFGEEGTVVDVGGGQGATLAAVLIRHRSLRGVLSDRTSLGSAGNGPLDDPRVSGRFTIVEGDFFDSVPHGGDYYILSSILHDWSDLRALTILRNCRRAMSPGAKLLVVERIIDPGGEEPNTRLSDMFMLALLGGRERTAVELTGLLATEGFAVTRRLATKSPFSIVEGSYACSSCRSLDE
jgi:hypothetical protein